MIKIKRPDKKTWTLVGVTSIVMASLLGLLSLSINIGIEKKDSFDSDNILITDNIAQVIEVSEQPEILPSITVIVSKSVPTREVVKTQTPTEQPIATITLSPSPVPTIAPTIPESPSAFVAFYSDPQSDSDAEDGYHRQVVNNILAKGANPVFCAGDIMEDGTQASLDRFNAVTATLRSSRTFYSALGNNDRVEGDSSTPSSLYLNNFSFPNNERWYSVNYGNLHLVVLDSAFAASNPSQLSWLSSDLQSEASRSRITGVMFHHPSFASTISSYLVNNNVDFVIMGHNHAYSHYNSNGIEYFVNGGQPNLGYFIARIYSERVELSVYSQNNGLVSTFNFNNR